MTAVFKYGDMRLEFSGTADFVTKSIRGVVCDGVSLAELFGSAFIKERSSLLLETGCVEGSSKDDGGIGECNYAERGGEFDPGPRSRGCGLFERNESVEVDQGSESVVEGVGTGSGDCDVDVGVKGAVPLVGSDVSARTLVNREKRRKSKERRMRKRGHSGVQCKDTGVDLSAGELQRSVQEKWIAKNQLERMKAVRELELLRVSSVDDEARRRAVRAKADTERAMVAIEKSHARLVSSDCVPGVRSSDGGTPLIADDGVLLGRVETVVTGCSISPESSASMADYRRCQKELLDANKRNEELLVENAKFIKKLEKIGVPLEHVDHLAKSEWTCDVVGGPTAENALILEEIYPHGWTISPEDTTLDISGKLTARVFGY